MVLLLIYIFVMFGVVALAATLGGRYERASAALILAMGVLSQTTGSLLRGTPADAVVLTLLNVGVLVGLIWLYRRHRAPWVALQLLAHAVSIPVDVMVEAHRHGPWGATAWTLWWIQSVLVYSQLVILTWAVLRRHFGPPYPLPRSA